MALALGGARADGAPADQLGDVLRRDHVKEFGAGGHAHLGEVKQEPASEAEAVVDAVGLVEERVIDEALPAEGGAWFLKIDAHDDAELGGELGHDFFEAASVFACGGGVVDGAGAGDDQQPVVALVQDVHDLAARMEDSSGCRFGNGHLLFQEDRRQNNFCGPDAQVVSAKEHGLFSV